MTPRVNLECFSFIINDGENRVSWDYQDSWICTCEDFYYRKHECKHIKTVKKELLSQVQKALTDNETCYSQLDKTTQSKLVIS